MGGMEKQIKDKEIDAAHIVRERETYRSSTTAQSAVGPELLLTDLT